MLASLPRDLAIKIAGILAQLATLPQFSFLTGFVGAVAPGTWFLLPILASAVGPCEPEIVGKSFRMMSSDLATAVPFERDWEIFIPKAHALDALKFAHGYFKANQICLPLTGVLIRFALAESETLLAHTVALTPQEIGQPGIFFEMPVFMPRNLKCSDQARYEKAYADLAETLVKPPPLGFGGRAHWAKNRRSLFQLERKWNIYGDNLRRFRNVVKRIDPTGIFANQFGVDMGLRWPQSPVFPKEFSETETKGCVPG